MTNLLRTADRLALRLIENNLYACHAALLVARFACAVRFAVEVASLLPTHGLYGTLPAETRERLAGMTHFIHTGRQA